MFIQLFTKYQDRNSYFKKWEFVESLKKYKELQFIVLIFFTVKN